MTVQVASLKAADYPVHKIRIRDILINPSAPSMKRARTTFEDINELAASIKDKGLINPIMVSRLPVGSSHPFVLVAGERRLRATVYLELEEIDARIREELPPLVLKELELEENIQRSDLTWQEELELRNQIHEVKMKLYGSARDNKESGWSLEKTAALVGADGKATISKQLKLAKKLKERPDLAEKVKNYSMSQAAKVIDQIELSEKAEKMVETGVVKISADVKLGSCLDLAAELLDESVDLWLTDMPFGLEEINTDAGDETRVFRKEMGQFDNLNLSTVTVLMEQLCPIMFQKMRTGAHGMIFFTMDFYHSLTTILSQSGFSYNPVPVIWDKMKMTAPFSGYRFAPCYEPILHLWKPIKETGNGRRFNCVGSTIIKAKPLTSQEKVHIFEKPQSLLLDLIKMLSNPGETVVDTFAGSGSTIIAARSIGRTGIGFEIDKENWMRSQVRLMDVCNKQPS